MVSLGSGIEVRTSSVLGSKVVRVYQFSSSCIITMENILRIKEMDTDSLTASNYNYTAFQTCISSTTVLQ